MLVRFVGLEVLLTLVCFDLSSVGVSVGLRRARELERK